MGKKSRDKGKRGEREWVRLLRRYGFCAQRTGYMQSRGSDDAPDVTQSFAVAEVKLRKGLSISDLYNGVQQVASAKGHAGKLRYFAGRKDRQPWIVAMDAPNFLRLYFSYFLDRVAHAKLDEALEAMLRAGAEMHDYGGSTELVLPFPLPFRPVVMILHKAYASPLYAGCRVIIESGNLMSSREVECDEMRVACDKAQRLREAVNAERAEQVD